MHCEIRIIDDPRLWTQQSDESLTEYNCSMQEMMRQVIQEGSEADKRVQVILLRYPRHSAYIHSYTYPTLHNLADE